MSLSIILRKLSTFSLANLYLHNAPSKVLSSYCQMKRLSSKRPENFVKTIDPATGEEKKKKTAIIPKITLFVDERPTITTLEDAQKLSRRRDLKLVKIIDLDSKTQRPVYKLMTGSELHLEDVKQREVKKKAKESSLTKGEKLLMLNSNISEHDLQTQVKKIIKWIEKAFEVRLIISGSSEQGEKVYSLIEGQLKDKVRFVQKRTKGTDIKTQIIPPKKSKECPDNAPLVGNRRDL